MTHTPGPWDLFVISSPLGESYRVFAGTPEEGAQDIAHIPLEWAGDGSNARLIAQAPDLYREGRALVDAVQALMLASRYGDRMFTDELQEALARLDDHADSLGAVIDRATGTEVTS